ncbi:MAG: hypothetical protein RAP70_02450 [Candidatus Celaenobacter antarcticus]|nr:hypothetical protein [Candidatus Celaenobacter antarcticus]
MILEKLRTNMINNWVLFFLISLVLLWISFMTIGNLTMLALRANALMPWWKAIISSFLASAFVTVYVFKIKKKKS